MTKTEMTQVLRSVGVNENTVTAMENAFDIGVEFERDRCIKISTKLERVKSSNFIVF